MLHVFDCQITAAAMTWCLVGNTGAVHILPQSMIFVGRDNCDINIQSRSVDKRHSVINFDQYDKAFFIKDMETLNGFLSAPFTMWLPVTPPMAKGMLHFADKTTEERPLQEALFKSTARCCGLCGPKSSLSLQTG
ncbi:uncharacterized protein LOC110986334 [Acanthaster planci]|uniref:Uncharacterized protein LOC110986334 n=1 Tax=Acanthaster planci TaxID=133434 RepID=A0A8B7ZFN5_ACAPL|nr:uncharacterized protein LOC110986334 [Acanthaster planci]